MYFLKTFAQFPKYQAFIGTQLNFSFPSLETRKIPGKQVPSEIIRTSNVLDNRAN